MKEEILSIASDLREGSMSTNEAKEHLLRLFGVMESDCEHEWINDSFDHFGFLTGQVCDKCGAKQSVP
jgi:hypothetical protein